MKFGIFSNNVLKIIACVTMLIDHIGAILFPTVYALRFIGRISLPIFIFLLAEGCYYTKNKIRHLLVIGSFAVVMQVVLYLATKIIFFSIFIHFTIAIILCYIIDIIDIFIRCKKRIRRKNNRIDSLYFNKYRRSKKNKSFYFNNMGNIR